MTIYPADNKNVRYHKQIMDIQLNKSDLTLYLSEFKKSVLNYDSRNFVSILKKIANFGFLISIFFTSNFNEFKWISAHHLELIYILLAVILIYDIIITFFKK